MSASTRTRVAWITNAYAPYRVPLWNAVARDCDLTVILLSEKRGFRPWHRKLAELDCNLLCLPGRLRIAVPRLDWTASLSVAGLRSRLDEIAPDVVLLGGYDSPGYWSALSWARRRRLPAVLWAESTLLSSRTAGWRGVTAVKRAFVRRCDSFYAAGIHAAEYLEFLGAPRERIVVGSNVCHAGDFRSAAKVGGGPPALLFAGQLIARKNLGSVLRALLPLRHLPWTLEVAGSGPLERELRAFAGRNLPGRVYWLGSVPPECMSVVYRHADIALMPSLVEVWGMVAHEALLSGAYLIGSTRAAGALELVRPGRNGLLVEPRDVDGLTRAIATALLRMPFDREAIRRTVARLTPEREAFNIGHALLSARQLEPAHAAD